MGNQAEDVGGSLGVHVEVALEHVGGIALEGEDCRVIEHAEHGDYPEEFARQDVLDVGNLEFLVGRILGGGSFLGGNLMVETGVHECEHDIGNQANQEEGSAECDGSHDAGFAHPG